MSTPQLTSGFVPIGDARIYYEAAGTGLPVVMIHAGVADARQWSREFAFLSQAYRAVRYDMRGYGRSEPAAGEFSHMGDLVALLDALDLREPCVLVGCSLGGGLAMDFALAHPSRVIALVMVGSGPSGLALDVETPALFEEAERAYEAGDWAQLAEIETRIWFDGTGRTPDQVDPVMRALLFEMNSRALAHHATRLGTQLPDADTPAAGRLGELDLPVLIVVGAHDTPYMLAAADHMERSIPSARRVTIDDAAHLVNMDRPDEFRALLQEFLEGLPR